MANFSPNKELDTYTNQLSDNIIGETIEVHRILDPRFLERIYEEALAIELEKQGIKFQQQYEFAINYEGQNIGLNKLDLLVENHIIVELKTVESILPIYKAQIISYLKVTNLHLGLLINFDVTLLKKGIHHIVLS